MKKTTTQQPPDPSRRDALGMAAAAVACLAMPAAFGAEFPDHPVRLINPYATGGTLDVAAHWLSEKMRQHLGQPVIVEPKPGASGVVAATFVAKGPKDGYLLFFGTSSSLGFAKLLNRDLPYDPVRDFTPVAMVGSVPVCIYTSPDTGFNSIRDLVVAAKAKPGQLSYGTTGAQSLSHLAAEMLCQEAGITMTHIPYTGSGAKYFTDLIGGRTQAVFAGASGGLPLVEAGRLKLLGTATARRSRSLPDVPAVGELYPGFDVPAWFGFAVAAGTPEPIVQRLEVAVLAALRDPTTRPAFAKAGIELDPIMGSRELAAKINDEMAMWEKLLTRAGMIK